MLALNGLCYECLGLDCFYVYGVGVILQPRLSPPVHLGVGLFCVYHHI
jgi:hypothetical protein